MVGHGTAAFTLAGSICIFPEAMMNPRKDSVGGYFPTVSAKLAEHEKHEKYKKI